MSGGIAQLVAVGAQDAHLVGQPEVSFFRSSYRRHTNFAQTVERQVLQGIPTNGGISTVRFERKGDLLGYAYITQRTPAALTKEQWANRIKKVELLIKRRISRSTSHQPSWPKTQARVQTALPRAPLDSTHFDFLSVKTGNRRFH
jgi:hypothetical protein